MDRLIIVERECEGVTESDVLAMLSMLDHLVVRNSRMNDISTTCLVLARQSLATFTARSPGPR